MADETQDDAAVLDIPTQATGREAEPAQQQAEPSTQNNDALAKAIQGLTEKVNAPTAAAKPAERQPTQEEINEYWGVFDPQKSDPQFYDKMFRLPADMDPAEKQQVMAQLKETFAMMQTGIVKQSLTGSRNLMAQMREELMKEFKPAQEYVSTQRQEQTKNKFFETYPVLAEKGADGKPKFDALIAAHASQLQTQGKTFPTEGDFFKALAESVAGTIKGVIPEFDLGAKTKPNTAVTTPRLPRARVGGTGGSGGQGGQQADAATSKDDSAAIAW